MDVRPDKAPSKLVARKPIESKHLGSLSRPLLADLGRGPENTEVRISILTLAAPRI